MLASIFWIVIGFVLLIKGADFLVSGSSIVAKKFKIPEIVIGLTVVSIGTSMPELFVSVTSLLNGYSDMSIGNIIGSNVCNLLLILGLSTILCSIEFKKDTIRYEIPMCLFVTILLLIFCNISNDLSRIEGFVFIILFTLFISYTIYKGIIGNKTSEEKVDISGGKLFVSVCYIIVGIVGLKLGGDMCVDNSVILAKNLGLSEKVIGLTILAIGTSLPELVTSVTAAYRKNCDIAIGNIIGSNIFNILWILGLASTITPVVYNTSYNIQLIILIISTILLLIFPFFKPKNKMGKKEGLLYLILYALYLFLLFMI